MQLRPQRESLERRVRPATLNRLLESVPTANFPRKLRPSWIRRHRRMIRRLEMPMLLPKRVATRERSKTKSPRLLENQPLKPLLLPSVALLLTFGRACSAALNLSMVPNFLKLTLRLSKSWTRKCQTPRGTPISTSGPQWLASSLPRFKLSGRPQTSRCQPVESKHLPLLPLPVLNSSMDPLLTCGRIFSLRVELSGFSVRS